MRTIFSYGKYLVIALLLLIVFGCEKTIDDTPETKPSLTSLFVEKNTISLKVDETKSVLASAFDDNGNAETIGIASDNADATADITSNGFTVTGKALGTTLFTITSASGLSEELKVIVYDPKCMDIGNGLLIKFTGAFDKVYDDGGSGGDYDAWWGYPQYDAANGWYPVGSIIQQPWDTTHVMANNYAVLVKDSSQAQDLLAAPTDFTFLYNDSGSGADMYGSVWKPVAPAGYVAMGYVVVRGYDKPSVDCIRCVKKEYTAPGKVGAWMYDNGGDGGTYWLFSWEQLVPDNYYLNDGEMFLLPGTNLASSGSNASDVGASINNVFVINVPVVEEADNTLIQPKLKNSLPFASDYPRFVSRVRVPFTIVKDPATDRTVSWKIANSPFYFIERNEKFNYVNGLDNTSGTSEGQLQYSYSTGFSTTDTETFSKEVGVEVSVSGGASILGTGGKWSLKLSMKLGWQSQTSNTYSTSESTTYTIPVPAGKCMQFVQVISNFDGYDGIGNHISTLPMNSSIVKVLEYPN